MWVFSENAQVKSSAMGVGSAEIEKAIEFWQNAKLIGTGSDMLEKKINTKTLIE